MKKKILFVTNHLEYSNGVANVLVELVNSLDKYKYDITIMPIYRCDDEYIKKFREGIKIQRVFKGYFKGLSKILSILPKKLLYNSWIKENYDIEVAFQYGTPTEVLAYSTNKNAQHIAWMHGYGEQYLDIHKKYDSVICCSKTNRDKYKKAFSQPQKVKCLYNLVNDNDILEKSKERLDAHKEYGFTFCTVGRLSPEKGFDRLLECHKRLMQEGLCHNLWIVGGGSEYEKLDSYVKTNQLDASVKLFGAQKNPYNYMANCDMFVCSSRSEGFSTVCVEAGIIGKSILTTEVAGAEEFVSNNKIGMMVKNDDEALYQGMKYILQNQDAIKQYESNLSAVPDMHYNDRLRAVEEFFEKGELD